MLIDGIGRRHCTKSEKQLNSADIWEGRRTAPRRVEKTSVMADVKYIRSTLSRFRDVSLRSTVVRIRSASPYERNYARLPKTPPYIIQDSVRGSSTTRYRTNSFHLCSSSLPDGFLNVSLSILDDKLNITFIFVATSCAREAIHTFMSFSWMPGRNVKARISHVDSRVFQKFYTSGRCTRVSSHFLRS